MLMGHSSLSPSPSQRNQRKEWGASGRVYTQTYGAFRNNAPANCPKFNAISHARSLRLHAALVAEQQAEWT